MKRHSQRKVKNAAARTYSLEPLESRDLFSISPLMAVGVLNSIGGSRATYPNPPGMSWVIPASGSVTIQAENYDTGGEGVAYHDLDAGNQGKTYRTCEGVDVEACASAGGGYDVGYIGAGEWLEYSVNVASSGTYTLGARVASKRVGGTFHIEVDRMNVTGSLSVPMTGSWQTWQMLSKSGVNLTAGQHIVRVAFDANSPSGPVTNIDSIQFAAQAGRTTYPNPPGTSWVIPASGSVTIQAENYDTGGEGVAYHDLDAANQGKAYRTGEGVDVEARTTASGGYDVGYVSAGEWLEYSVNVASSGSYTLGTRVASRQVGGKFHIEVDRTNVTGSLNVPMTGSWQTWQVLSKSGVNLTAGQHIVRVVFDANSPSGPVANLDSIQFTASTSDWFSQNLLDGALVSLARRLDSDQVFSRDDMIAVLATVEQQNGGVVSSNDLHDLRAIVANAPKLGMPSYVQVLANDVVNGSPANASYQGHALGNLAVGSSAGRLELLVDKWFLGTDHPVSDGYYETFSGRLFNVAPHDTDSNQGDLGDCYFVASLDALARNMPDTIRGMFIDNGDGTFTVRFFKNGVADYVTVDSMLPVDGYGSALYASTGGAGSTDPGNVLWMALAEKAYAQWNETGATGRSDTSNNYYAIEGGWMFNVDRQVLGHDASTYWGFADADEATLVQAIQSGRAVTMGSKPWPHEDDVVGGHAYEVAGYDATTRCFLLRNPWGTDDPAPLSYGQLADDFQCFVVA